MSRISVIRRRRVLHKNLLSSLIECLLDIGAIFRDAIRCDGLRFRARLDLLLRSTATNEPSICATKRESHHCCSQVAEPHAYPLSIDRLAIFDFAFIAARSPIQKCVTINSPLINFACLAFVPKELLEMNRRAHRTCANNNGG